MGSGGAPPLEPPEKVAGERGERIRDQQHLRGANISKGQTTPGPPVGARCDGQALGRGALVHFNGYPLSMPSRYTRYSSGGLTQLTWKRGLISRTASRLDAVSAYPGPT